MNSFKKDFMKVIADEKCCLCGLDVVQFRLTSYESILLTLKTLFHVPKNLKLERAYFIFHISTPIKID